MSGEFHRIGIHFLNEEKETFTASKTTANVLKWQVDHLCASVLENVEFLFKNVVDTCPF